MRQYDGQENRRTGPATLAAPFAPSTPAAPASSLAATMAAVWTVLAARLCFELFDVSALLKIGRLDLHGSDIAVAACIPVLLRAALFPVLKNVGQLLLLGLACLVALSLLRGVTGHGLFAALLSFRGDAAFFALLLAFAFIPRTADLDRRVFRALVVAGWCLVILALARFALGTNFLKISGDIYSTRVLRADGALLLGQVAALLAGLALSGSLSQKKSLLHLLAALLFLLVTVASGQRTALVAALAGFGTVLLLQAGPWRCILRLALPVTALLAGMAVAAAILDMGMENFLRAMPDSIQGMFGSRTTFTFRQLVWHSMLGQFHALPWPDQFLGVPHGRTFVWILQDTGQSFSHSLHNHALSTLLHTGYLGLGLFLSLWLAAIARNFLANRAGGSPVPLSPAVCTGLVVSQLVYATAYGLSGEQGLFLGLVLAVGRFGEAARKR